MISFILAAENDTDILWNLAHKIWFDHYYPDILTKEQIEYMLNMMYSKNVIVDEIKKGFSWYLIKDDDKPIGFLSFSYFKENNCVKLHKLYVLLLYHGKGIGRQALDFVKNYAHKLNAVYVYLHVNKQNLKAIKAYQKAGFYIHHLEYNDIGNNFFMDDYVMKFDL